MQTIRKPRVFLSHSKKDVDFIRRLETDLRAAQCEPWIDDIELRAGQPWLDQIFGSGIPSCEVVLCYFTQYSAESAVFMQELDARLIERLHNSRVTLLLYVSTSELRPKLRLDLQRLQVPELNEKNYSAVFPRLVAEIWRSYAESLTQIAIDSEKVKRLEAELRIKELEGEASASIFTTSEQTEFKAIWARLDRKLAVEATISKKLVTPSKPTGDTGTGKNHPDPQDKAIHKLDLDFGIPFRSTILQQKYQPSSYDLYTMLGNDALFQLGLDQTQYKASLVLPIDIEMELLKFGLVQRNYSPPPINEDRFARSLHRSINLVFTSKFDRFGLWIDHSFGNLESSTHSTKL